MTLETFFEKFDLFADAPDAVAKMRELVLDLAVRGKLVVQNVTDESAAQLLKRVLAEKNRRTGRSERSDEESGSPPDDEAFEIPGNWEWIGATRPAVMVSDQGKKVQTRDILEAGKYPVVDQGKMFIRGYCDDYDKVISVAEPIVLFGDHTRETKFIDFDFVVGADGVKLLQPICIDPRFYFLVLRWLPLESRGYARHFKLLKAARIPLPPLAEQKRIVAKVDELMALCDRLEVQQQERETRHAALARASLARFADAPTPANLSYLFHSSFSIPPSDLRKSILTLTVQGKLVHRVTSDGIGSDILKDSKVTEAPPDDVPDLPEHWTWALLGSIATRMDSGWSPACSSEPADIDEWGVLKTTAVQTLQYLEVQNKALPSSLSPRPEHEVLDGDILFTRAGPMNRVGILCVARPTRKKLMISDKIIRIHLVAGIDPDFAALAMNAGHSSNLIEGLKSGMAASQVNISQPKLRSVPIPIPPLAEQCRIVAKVEQLMALVDALETQLATSRATAANLLSALVAELTQPS